VWTHAIISLTDYCMLHTVYSMQIKDCGGDVWRNPRTRSVATFHGCMCLVSLFLVQPFAWGWGEAGHVLSGKAAAITIPATMPEFFRKAADQLGYLTAEPDRWRDRSAPAVTDAFNPDHAINLELVPPGGLEAKDRFVYLAMLQNAGQTSAVGMAPFRTLEMYQRLRVEFRLWRTSADPQTRGWIEQRIINDAGILGHYVTDGSEPLHTTINHHGWIGDNPRGYATDPQIHSRFESEYVESHIVLSDITSKISGPPRTLTDAQAQIVAYFRATHEQVVPLYELDKKAPFNADTTAPENKVFVVQRLVFGVNMLRDIWWSAWVTSAPPMPSAALPPA
jgi:hypothetical protein